VIDADRPSRRWASFVKRTATVAAVVLVSMGAAGGPGPRLGPGWRADGPDAPAGSGRAGGGSDSGPAGVDAVRPIAPPNVPAADFTASNVVLSLTLVAGGFNKPVLVTNAGDGSGRLFVVEQTGRVWIIAGGSRLPTPFLALGSITTGGERGLLGLAFHPRFPTVPYVYVNFTDRNGDTAIARYTVGSDPNQIQPGSGVRLLTIGQPYANHNGGNLAFGPDGYLYIGMGDGGSAGDPGNRAQNVGTLLGKMLRIDVDRTSSGKRYAIPTSNPYVGKTGLDEIWSRGLRNPWRWSFDRATGNLWIGDVGQGRYEEIDRNPKLGTTPAGRAANYGWNVLEGRACYKPATGCSKTGKWNPTIVYSHAVSGADNCSVTGGFVYRGTADPVLRGGYVFGDYCSGRMWVVDATAPTPATPTLVRDATASPHLAISSFGEDEDGELYVCDLAGGAIYRIRAQPKA
jgi:glucose/arabinose dehydrogenase